MTPDEEALVITLTRMDKALQSLDFTMLSSLMDIEQAISDTMTELKIKIGERAIKDFLNKHEQERKNQ